MPGGKSVPNELVRYPAGLLRRLEQHGITGDERPDAHSGKDRQGKVPRRDYRS